MLERLDYSIALAVHRPFYISICISTSPTQHTAYIKHADDVAILEFKGDQKL